nr:hypothetical protein [Pseudodesulfovibrio sp.]
MKLKARTFLHYGQDFELYGRKKKKKKRNKQGSKFKKSVDRPVGRTRKFLNKKELSEHSLQEIALWGRRFQGYELDEAMKGLKNVVDKEICPFSFRVIFHKNAVNYLLGLRESDSFYNALLNGFKRDEAVEIMKRMVFKIKENIQSDDAHEISCAIIHYVKKL